MLEAFNSDRVAGLNLDDLNSNYYLLKWRGGAVPEELKIGHYTMGSMRGGMVVNPLGIPVARYVRLSKRQDPDQSAIFSVKKGVGEVSASGNVIVVNISSHTAGELLTPGSDVRKIVEAFSEDKSKPNVAPQSKPIP